MNHSLLEKTRGGGLSVIALSTLLFASCTVSYDPETFDPGVSNTTLKSPEVTIASNPDGSKSVLTWPVVYGASGIKISLYNVDDANNPVPVIVDTIIDGSTAELPRVEDTYYKLVVQSLGNTKYNNKDSETAEIAFNSWVPKINETAIPAGTDLYQWFSDNAALVEAQTEEFSVELQAGAEYTMSQAITLGSVPFVLYANSKTTNATIKMGQTAGITTEAGVKLKFLTFDCTDMTDKNTSIIALKKEPTIEKVAASSNPSWNLASTQPIVLNHVYTKDLKSHLVWSNNVCWTVNTILLRNCIIGLDQKAQKANGGNSIDMSYGFVYNLTVENSTVYSTTSLSSSDNGAFFVICSNRPQQYLNGAFPTSQYNYLNTTWYNISKSASGKSVAMFSYGRLKGQNCHTTITKNNIFVDCSSNRVVRLGITQGQNGGMKTEFANNCYWYDGADTGGNDWDKGDRVTFDPQLTQTAEGYFTVGGAEVKAAKCGDPRGLE